MKIVALLALISLTFEILDRSYYDALGTISFIQSYQSAQARNKFARPSGDSPKSITQIETLAQGNDSRRSMSVEMQ